MQNICEFDDAKVHDRVVRMYKPWSIVKDIETSNIITGKVGCKDESEYNCI